MFDRVLFTPLEVLLKPANIGGLYHFHGTTTFYTRFELWIIEAKDPSNSLISLIIEIFTKIVKK